MMLLRTRRVWRGPAVAAVLVVSSPACAIPVFDVGNYAQNVLQAARALEQINNQIRALQNQATMIEGMVKNLDHLDFSSLPQLANDLQQVGQLMNAAQGIGFQIDQTQQRFQTLFPTTAASANTTTALANATARLQAVRSALQDSVAIQSRIVGNAATSAATLTSLVTQSQSAHGSLQAAQATNQLLALVAKQQVELQALLAAQARADAVDKASTLQAQSDAQAATRRFLGSGQAYTPQ
jgi:P-type conjugative transfer protein TrbJ